VVVPTRGRPLRLRWLLNALAEQTLPRDRFEVVVAHNEDDAETARVLAGHPLRPGTVRLRRGAGPAALRNAAWRTATAPLIAFTDDDCRPPADWLANLLEAAGRHPGAIVQGATRPDPDELGIHHHAPHARSQEIEPPHVMAQTCNIAYPRAVLERAGGFDETFPQAVGEDTDLALRARAAGAPYVAAPEALTYHAVDWGLVRRVRGSWRWQHMALLVRKHPGLRAELPLGGWAWKAEHARWLAAAAGLVLARRSRIASALALPWIAGAPRTYGSHPRALVRTASELPGRFVIDGVETAALLRGSARYRSLLL
jgi:glycosyltransferase involved in cell wall biosynthesis